MRRALLSLLLGIGCASPGVTPQPGERAPRLDVGEVNGLGLFRDERARARQLVARALSARGVSIAPPEELERAWTLAADGRSPLTGESCGRPLPRWLARRRWGAALGVSGSASASASCPQGGACALTVYSTAVDGGPPSMLVAELDSASAALPALEASLARLAPPPNTTTGVGGLGLLGARGHRALRQADELELSVSPADVRVTSPLSREDRARALGLTVEQVTSCLSSDDSSARLLVDVDPAGLIGRCEGELDETAPELEACLCGRLRALPPPRALSGRRWSVDLRVRRRDLTSPDGTLIVTGSWHTHLTREQRPGEKHPRMLPKVEDPSLADWSPGPARLAARCFTSTLITPATVKSRWAVWFGVHGRPTKIVEQKGYPPLAPEVATCVRIALKTALAPCPARENLWAMADLIVDARAPDAPPPELPAGPQPLPDVLGP
ncbi:MAG: hypothetical protein ACOZQL_20855 [Myxococcota bacterium]